MYPEKKIPEPQVSGCELFEKVCRLGIGRFYYQKTSLADALPPPDASDTLARIEHLINRHPPEAKMILSSPFAVVLPVNLQETAHVIIFQDGQIALVSVNDSSKEQEYKTYSLSFSLANYNIPSVIDAIMAERLNEPDKWTPRLKEKHWVANYKIVDPLANDESMETVLKALRQVLETGEILKEQRAQRQQDFLAKASEILKG